MCFSPLKKLTDPCFVFSGARTGEKQAVINMQPSSCKRGKLSHLQPLRLKSLKRKKQRARALTPSFPSPHVPFRQAAPQNAPLRPPFPEQSLPIGTPGAAHKHRQDLLNVKSGALWCHPTAIWGEQRLSNYIEQSLDAFNYPQLSTK